MQTLKDHWREQLSGYRPWGGESLRAYCAARNLPYYRARYWRRAFLSDTSHVLSSPGAADAAPCPLPERLTFDVIPLASPAPSSASGVTLSAGGVEIRLASGFDADTLRRALGVLCAGKGA